jgi:hypothetical protein
MSVGTLDINEGGMIKGIHVKLVVSYVLNWNRDHPVARSIVLLQQ